MHVLFLESYYGGSHKYFLDNILEQFKIIIKDFSYELITLPPRHWRWRIQGSHHELAKLANSKSIVPDIIFISSLTNTANLRGLLKKELRNLPIVTVFHENQLAYPENIESHKTSNNKVGREFIFPEVHLSQIKSSDLLVFNSHYNKNTLLSGIDDFIKKTPDLTPEYDIEKKSYVLGVGCISNTSSFDFKNKKKRILWNHRWEHDKNPKEFSKLSEKILSDHSQNSLSLLGDNYQGKCDHVFNHLRQNFKPQISSWGKVDSHQEYLKQLSQCKVLPVTSNHDFFGISIVEAISNGVIPLLPMRLSYPELIPNCLHEKLLYNSFDDLCEKTKFYLENDLTSDDISLLEKHLSPYTFENYSHRLYSCIKSIL